MYQTELLKVTGISEPKVDKNGINFISIELSTPSKKRVKDVHTGEVISVRSRVRKRKINVFEHNYLDLSNLAKEQEVEIKKLKKDDYKDIDFDFAYDAEIGDQLEGKIVTKKVYPYDIPDRVSGEVRTVSFYTAVVLGDSQDEEGFEQAINQKFKADNHQLLNENFARVLETEDKVEEPAKVFEESEETN